MVQDQGNKGGFFHSVGSFFNSIYHKAESAVTTVYHDGRNAISSIWHNVDHNSRKLIDKNAGDLSKAMNTVQHLGGDVEKTVSNVANSGQQAISNVAKSGQQAISDSTKNFEKGVEGLSLPIMIGGAALLGFVLLKK